eukprot:TRINITY_DN1078_c0_g1_i1.p1 TRINITY_DN1078_c0_g1~~TRINITY_DN1078_c0_g1_i1.p1  ORF type:complete len:445 (+),score=97.57 TRINITY_DN1078_c0_g1_i1:45-1379(+)
MIKSIRHNKNNIFINILNSKFGNINSIENFRKEHIHKLEKTSNPQQIFNSLMSNQETLMKLKSNPNDITKDFFDKIHTNIDIPTIHVAGTKGKGSICAFIDSLLRIRNLNTIRFSSPHIRDVSERILFNGDVNKEYFENSIVETWNRFVDMDNDEIAPAFFRFMTGAAFIASELYKPDVLILETGIGGKDDSTNICKPMVTGISRIDFDHQEILGETLLDIIKAKLGIVKPSIPCFIAPQNSELEEEVMLNHCITVEPYGKGVISNFGIAGPFSNENAAIAVAMVQCFFRCQGLEPLSPDEIRKGLKDARLVGRCDFRVKGNNHIAIDGCHTPKSIHMALEWLIEEMSAKNKALQKQDKKLGVFIDLTYNRIFRVESILKDSLAILKSGNYEIFARHDNIVNFFRENQVNCTKIDPKTLINSFDGDLIFVGSLYLAAEIDTLLK